MNNETVDIDIVASTYTNLQATSDIKRQTATTTKQKEKKEKKKRRIKKRKRRDENLRFRFPFSVFHLRAKA